MCENRSTQGQTFKKKRKRNQRTKPQDASMVNGACPHRKASLQVNQFTSLMWYYSNYHVQRMSKFN